MTLSDGDLFELAGSLAELLGAPVTIEDRDSTVVAYSGSHQDVDAARIGTILDRQVPPSYRRALVDAGVFERLATSDDVVVVDLPELGMTTRAVVAMRDEAGRLIGSIWAATGTAPDGAQCDVLHSAAPTVARQLRRDLDRMDTTHRERTAAVERLVSGGEHASSAAAERGLPDPVVVAALGARGSLPVSVHGSFSLHLTALEPRAVCGATGDVLRAVLPAGSAVRIVEAFMARAAHGVDLAAGVGRAGRASGLDVSSADADMVLDVLVRRERFGEVAGVRDVFVDLAVDRVRAFLHDQSPASPLTTLDAYDAANGTELVASVRAFLQTGGDVAEAAARLHVHPNTVRNRLQRARAACGVDVADADTRLALLLHLRASG